jgi:3-phenylpropionate/trans-cinnamate dioxygenase ferredoxin reductase component
LRTIADADAIHEAFAPGIHLALIGGGYVGLEVAAAARKRDIKATVLEAQSRVLARVTSPEISTFYERVHRDAGVVIKTDSHVRKLEVDPSSNRIVAVVCSDGTAVPVDLVIVGIGLVPNTELAADAGLTVANGIVVDESTQTADPDIVAIGDCANHSNAHYGRRIRLESVPNALEQARVAAALLCGKPRAYASVPWFWSDQYDLKLQMVGLSEGYDQVVIHGSIEAKSFAAFFLKDGCLIAADTVNRAPEFMAAKRLVAAHACITPERLADETLPVKALLEGIPR